MLNFNSPYLAQSFSDFWRRWNISLSSWFKDYVYIPLGGNRVSFAKMLRNIWIVFLLSGLWHGASWAFVVWGALHALYLSLEAVKRRIAGPIIRTGLLFRVLAVATVDIGVVFAWIFFRAGTIHDAVVYLQALFGCRWQTSMMALRAGSRAS